MTAQGTRGQEILNGLRSNPARWTPAAHDYCMSMSAAPSGSMRYLRENTQLSGGPLEFETLKDLQFWYVRNYPKPSDVKGRRITTDELITVVSGFAGFEKEYATALQKAIKMYGQPYLDRCFLYFRGIGRIGTEGVFESSPVALEKGMTYEQVRRFVGVRAGQVRQEDPFAYYVYRRLLGIIEDTVRTGSYTPRRDRIKNTSFLSSYPKMVNAYAGAIHEEFGFPVKFSYRYPTHYHPHYSVLVHGYETGWMEYTKDKDGYVFLRDHYRDLKFIGDSLLLKGAV